MPAYGSPSRNGEYIRQSDRKTIGVRRRPLEHAGRQIMDMKPHGKGNRGRPREIWMDAVDRDMKMVGLDRKMADSRRRWRTTIDDHCGDPR